MNRTRPDASPFLSVSEVAALAGCTRAAVLLAISSGRLPAVRVGRTWAISRELGEAWRPRRYVRRFPVRAATLP